MSEIVIGHLYTFPSIIYACQAQKRDNHRRYFVNDDASSQGATTVQMLGGRVAKGQESRVEEWGSPPPWVKYKVCSDCFGGLRKIRSLDRFWRLMTQKMLIHAQSWLLSKATVIFGRHWSILICDVRSLCYEFIYLFIYLICQMAAYNKIYNKHKF